jgi:hypothetical protein
MLIPCVADVIKDRVSNRSVSVDFFKGYLPLVMALLAIHGNHGIEGSTVLKAELARILNSFGQVLV